MNHEAGVGGEDDESELHADSFNSNSRNHSNFTSAKKMKGFGGLHDQNSVEKTITIDSTHKKSRWGIVDSRELKSMPTDEKEAYFISLDSSKDQENINLTLNDDKEIEGLPASEKDNSSSFRVKEPDTAERELEKERLLRETQERQELMKASANHEKPPQRRVPFSSQKITEFNEHALRHSRTQPEPLVEQKHQDPQDSMKRDWLNNKSPESNTKNEFNWSMFMQYQNRPRSKGIQTTKLSSNDGGLEDDHEEYGQEQRVLSDSKDIDLPLRLLKIDPSEKMVGLQNTLSGPLKSGIGLESGKDEWLQPRALDYQNDLSISASIKVTDDLPEVPVQDNIPGSGHADLEGVRSDRVHTSPSMKQPQKSSNEKIQKKKKIVLPKRFSEKAIEPLFKKKRASLTQGKKEETKNGSRMKFPERLEIRRSSDSGVAANTGTQNRLKQLADITFSSIKKTSMQQSNLDELDLIIKKVYSPESNQDHVEEDNENNQNPDQIHPKLKKVKVPIFKLKGIEPRQSHPESSSFRDYFHEEGRQSLTKGSLLYSDGKNIYGAKDQLLYTDSFDYIKKLNDSLHRRYGRNNGNGLKITKSVRVQTSPERAKIKPKKPEIENNPAVDGVRDSGGDGGSELTSGFLVKSTVRESGEDSLAKVGDLAFKKNVAEKVSWGWPSKSPYEEGFDDEKDAVLASSDSSEVSGMGEEQSSVEQTLRQSREKSNLSKYQRERNKMKIANSPQKRSQIAVNPFEAAQTDETLVLVRDSFGAEKMTISGQKEQDHEEEVSSKPSDRKNSNHQRPEDDESSSKDGENYQDKKTRKGGFNPTKMFENLTLSSNIFTSPDIVMQKQMWPMTAKNKKILFSHQNQKELNQSLSFQQDNNRRGQSYDFGAPIKSQISKKYKKQNSEKQGSETEEMPIKQAREDHFETKDSYRKMRKLKKKLKRKSPFRRKNNSIASLRNSELLRKQFFGNNSFVEISSGSIYKSHKDERNERLQDSEAPWGYERATEGARDSKESSSGLNYLEKQRMSHSGHLGFEATDANLNHIFGLDLMRMSQKEYYKRPPPSQDGQRTLNFRDRRISDQSSLDNYSSIKSTRFSPKAYQGSLKAALPPPSSPMNRSSGHIFRAHHHPHQHESTSNRYRVGDLRQKNQGKMSSVSSNSMYWRSDDGDHQHRNHLEEKYSNFRGYKPNREAVIPEREALNQGSQTGIPEYNESSAERKGLGFSFRKKSPTKLRGQRDDQEHSFRINTEFNIPQQSSYFNSPDFNEQEENSENDINRSNMTESEDNEDEISRPLIPGDLQDSRKQRKAVRKFKLKNVFGKIINGGGADNKAQKPAQIAKKFKKQKSIKTVKGTKKKKRVRSQKIKTKNKRRQKKTLSARNVKHSPGVGSQSFFEYAKNQDSDGGSLKEPKEKSFIEINKKALKGLVRYGKCQNCHRYYEMKDSGMHKSGRCVEVYSRQSLYGSDKS